jgi:hypothetical protein
MSQDLDTQHFGHPSEPGVPGHQAWLREQSLSQFYGRLSDLAGQISLPGQYAVRIAQDQEVPNGRLYFQIQCERMDIITGEMGMGYGGKAYLSEHATDSELVGTIFALYKAYVEHEARETFKYRGKRIFGPHIKVEALWEIARQVDVRSAMHAEDQR